MLLSFKVSDSTALNKSCKFLHWKVRVVKFEFTISTQSTLSQLNAIGKIPVRTTAKRHSGSAIICRQDSINKEADTLVDNDSEVALFSLKGKEYHLLEDHMTCRGMYVAVA